MKPPPVNLVELLVARELLRKGQRVDVRIDGLIERDAAELVRDAGAADSVIDLVITDQSEDRYGDTIATDGWTFENFEKNPVLLWAHDYRSHPVGKLAAPRTVGKKVKAKISEWVPREISEFAWATEQMMRRGFLNAVSVGFRPLTFEYNDDYSIKYMTQELLEVSVVPVPANANALVAAKAAGLWVPSIEGWMVKTLDEKQPGIALEVARRAFQVMKGATVPVQTNAPGAEGDEGPALPEVVELRAVLELHTKALEANTIAVKAFTAAIEKAMAPAPENPPPAPKPAPVRAVPPAPPTPPERPRALDVARIVASASARLKL